MPTTKRGIKAFSVLGIALLFIPAALARDQPPASELAARLQALPGVFDFQPVRANQKEFQEAYEFMFEQPLDHRNPDGEKFRQRIFVLHVDYEHPVLLETEGYGAYRPDGCV